MGAQSTQAMLQMVGEGLTSLPSEAILGWHLTANHFPALPLSLVPACQRAIELVSSDEGQRRVRLPRGLVSRDGRHNVTAADLVEVAHLWDFVEAQTSSRDDEGFE